jgi:hypothetical protein
MRGKSTIFARTDIRCTLSRACRVSEKSKRVDRLAVTIFLDMGGRFVTILTVESVMDEPGLKPGLFVFHSPETTMAKAKTNKSQMVRDMLTENPQMPVKDIVSTMAAKGQKVTPNLVYFLRMKAKAKKRRQVRQKVAKVVSSNGSLDAVTVIVKVKGLAAEVGGMGKLKELVEALA